MTGTAPAPAAWADDGPADEDLLHDVVADLVGGRILRSTSLELLVHRHGTALHRLASSMLRDSVLADDVVQETWVAALRGAAAFEGRSAVRTWLLSICANRARTHLKRERRVVPFTSAWRAERGDAVDPSAFTPAGGWVRPVTSWDDDPFDVVRAAELNEELAHLVTLLPPRQRQVVVARDVLGCTSAEVTDLYGLTAGNQRVLLHHGRAALRSALLSQDAAGESS